MAKGPWYLFDRQTQEQHKEIDITDCVELIHAKPADEWADLFAWREELSDWTPIMEVSELALALQPKDSKKKAPPPPAKVQTKASSGKGAKHDDQGSSEKRRFPRAIVRLRVIVRNEHLTFRTFTKNISLGGASLEHPIPPGLLTANCQIYLADPETSQNIRFKARIIHDRSDLRGIAFQNLNGDDQKKIQVWIEKFGSK